MKGVMIVSPRVCLFAVLVLVCGQARAESKKAAAKSSTPAPFSTVIVDAGHGGHDPGGIPQNIIPEKGVALDVAKRLKTHLEAGGLRVVMTRTEDVFITLGERVRIANAERNAIFVSVHFNSALRVGARGVENFYGSPTASPLAHLIQQKMLAVTVNPDFRPVKKAAFWVLRETKCPAVLVECGFLTNPEDAAQAQQETFRETLAKEIAAAVLEHRKSLGPAAELEQAQTTRKDGPPIATATWD
jgi:N-acetylmuramoyl-L-alanine amidase